MALTKFKIGDLINIIDERNSYGIKEFQGINIHKEFMPTAANTEGLNETNYKVVRKNRFVFSGMQTGRDECIRISMYTKEEPIIVSPAYTTFEITASNVVSPMYFFLTFLSKEKDRLGAFLSDGSIRSNLDWEVFCDIDIELPPLAIQQKYVDIYKAMVENQQTYERGLEDLKLVCDAYIEDLRRKMPCEEIGPYIQEIDNKNTDLELGLENVRGISIDKKFIPTKANMDGVPLANYKLVQPNYFSFNPNTARMGDKLSISLNPERNPILVSSIYPVFKVNTSKINAQYLFMWFCRTEFDRYVRFNSWGSARETYMFDDLCEFKIPIPKIETQQSIVNIYNAYNKRKEINEKLKAQIKEICPILIKGSIEEAKRTVEV